MIDRSAEFKAELIALMDKYCVMMDYIEERSAVLFYTDIGRGIPVALHFDREGEVFEDAANCIT